MPEQRINIKYTRFTPRECVCVCVLNGEQSWDSYELQIATILLYQIVRKFHSNMCIMWLCMCCHIHRQFSNNNDFFPFALAFINSSKFNYKPTNEKKKFKKNVLEHFLPVKWVAFKEITYKTCTAIWHVLLGIRRAFIAGKVKWNSFPFDLKMIIICLNNNSSSSSS